MHYIVPVHHKNVYFSMLFFSKSLSQLGWDEGAQIKIVSHPEYWFEDKDNGPARNLKAEYEHPTTKQKLTGKRGKKVRKENI